MRIGLSAIKTSRVEVVFIAIVSAVISLTYLGIIGVVTATDLPACATAPAISCSLFDPAMSIGDWLPFLSTAMAMLSGLLLGAPLVAREIESGTAVLAWSMGRSRTRWLLIRTASVALVVLVVAIVPSLLGDVWEHVRHVPRLPGDSLLTRDFRGATVVFRSLLLFSIGLLCGSLSGRQLPAVVIAVIVGVLAIGGLSMAFDAVDRAEAVPANEIGDMQLDVAFRQNSDATGALLSEDEAAARYGKPIDAMFNVQFTQVGLGIPASRAGDLLLRESAASSAIALLCLSMSVAVVGRRRPY